MSFTTHRRDLCFLNNHLTPSRPPLANIPACFSLIFFAHPFHLPPKPSPCPRSPVISSYFTRHNAFLHFQLLLLPTYVAPSIFSVSASVSSPVPFLQVPCVLPRFPAPSRETFLLFPRTPTTGGELFASSSCRQTRHPLPVVQSPCHPASLPRRINLLPSLT